MIIASINNKGSLFCSYSRVARLLNSWRNHLQTVRGRERSRGGATMPPPPSLPQRWDLPQIPRVSKVPGAPCPQWRSEPSVDITGSQSLKPHTPILPPSDWPMQRIKTSISPVLLPRKSTGVTHPQGFLSSRPFHISRPTGILPQLHTSPETPSRPTSLWEEEKSSFQKMFRCSPF